MSMLFRRKAIKAILPVWLVVIGLLAVFGSPLTLATSVLLFIVGAVPPAILFTLWKQPSSTIAEVLHRVEASPTRR